MKETDEIKELIINLGEKLQAVELRMKDVVTSINGNDLGTPGLSHQLRNHIREDERAHADIYQKHDAMAKDQKTIEIQIGRWGGGLAVLILLVGVGATLAAAWH